MKIHELVKEYLEYCEFQENLSADTRKAYRIDLTQFILFWQTTDQEFSRSNISSYIVHLQKKFKPRTAKRKTASLKAFFSWLEYMEIIEASPFVSLRFKFNEPQVLPRTIPLDIIAEILNAAYQEVRVGSYKAIRDVAVLELMFATGIRVSELCSLKPKSIDLNNGTVLIFGKGAKERVIQIGNPEVLAALKQYEERFRPYIQKCGYLFVNRIGRPYTTQSVRAMVNRYCKQVSPNLHITPHMFRHTFATQLLEADVDIRYIQSLLGHSSISTTQIYTHVTMTKQRDILATKHPRNSMNIDAGIEDTATL